MLRTYPSEFQTLQRMTVHYYYYCYYCMSTINVTPCHCCPQISKPITVAFHLIFRLWWKTARKLQCAQFTKKHKIIMEEVGCQLHQRWQNFWRKCRKTGRSHIGNALGNVCIANNRNNTYNCNSMSYNCHGTTSTQWSYSEKCWPCQDLNRNQLTK